MTNEVWKDVVGYEGLYQISNMGRVKSLNYRGTGKEGILKGVDNDEGYLKVALYKDKKQKRFLVHRLVAMAFIPNLENKPYIDHINTIRTDNRVENLRWATSKENNNNPLTLKKKSKTLKGKPRSEETRQKTSDYKVQASKKSGKNHADFSGGKNPKAKKVICDGMIFDCAKDCAEYYRENKSTMISWLNGRYKMPQRFVNLGLRYATEEDLKEIA